MLRPHSLRKRRSGGFTLIEVLLVLVILVILGGIAASNFSGISAGAKIKAATAQVGIVEHAMDLYQLDMSMYPETIEDLVYEPSSGTATSIWNGPYMKEIPLDPWGQAYIYEVPGNYNTTTYDFYSAGPDMAAGTEDDIGNWVEEY